MTEQFNLGAGVSRSEKKLDRRSTLGCQPQKPQI